MKGLKWIGVLSIAVCSTLWMAPGTAVAAADGYTPDDIELTSAGNLVDICTLETSHEHYTAGVAFCYGFFEGAIRYAQAISGADPKRKLVCEPAGTTRLQAVDVFVTYMNENPRYQDENSIDAIFRALTDRWPCPE